MRKKRESLSPQQIHEASAAICMRLWQLRTIQRAAHIAAYLATNNEVDCEPVVEEAWARKRRVYLPILAGKSLYFGAANPATEMRPNQFGILEPVVRARDLRSPGALDVVVVPLVAFDAEGNRVGMGGGFYDRSFAFLNRRNTWRHPKLIGVAYEFQRIDQLAPSPWDVRIDAVVTEKKVYVSR